MNQFRQLDPNTIESIVGGASTKAEGYKRLVAFVRHGLSEKKFTAENFSYKNLAIAMGAISVYSEADDFRRLCAQAISTEAYHPDAVFVESNPALGTNAFQIVTSELLASQITAGYDSEENWIGDELVEVLPGQRVRNQRIAGFTSLAGPEEVAENHPYSESVFEEKYVTTKEAKKGRILSITEELLLFDQTSEINRRARQIGYQLRLDKERTIVRGVIDADSATNPVYRPSGSGAGLYQTDGSNYNWLGSGNTTSPNYAGAVALANWTDLEEVFEYRAVAVRDDRVDGDPKPVFGLNGPNNVLLVPEALRGTADYIVNSINGHIDSFDGTNRQAGPNPVRGRVRKVLSSPFIDEVGGQALSDWYYGAFKKQFVWTEIWPVQTFTQGKDSEAGFDRDVALRIKARYYGGISATDHLWVTKVDGA